MKLEDILPQLQAWFPPEDHKERKLPGGGRWFYIPHQSITQRLNEVCPGEWHSEPLYPSIAGDYTVVYCKLTICGVTRTGIGDDKTFPDVNEDGKAKIIGTPPVRAFRNAFKDAAEQFGICGYLDEQKENREAFVRYMQKRGDNRALQFARENNWVEGSLPTAQEKQTRARAELASRRTQATPKLISEAQQKRLWAIAKNDGHYTEGGVKKLLEAYQVNSFKEITTEIYQELCLKAADVEAAAIYNRSAEAVANGAVV